MTKITCKECKRHKHCDMTYARHGIANGCYAFKRPWYSPTLAIKVIDQYTGLFTGIRKIFAGVKATARRVFGR